MKIVKKCKSGFLVKLAKLELSKLGDSFFLIECLKCRIRP